VLHRPIEVTFAFRPVGDLTAGRLLMTQSGSFLRALHNAVHLALSK
jgi:hypothetical protein